MSGVFQINNQFWQNFDKVIEEASVPRISINTVRPCAEVDFSDFKKALPFHLDSVISLLNIVLKHKNQCAIKNKKKLVKVTAIIGEQSCQNVWNTSEIVQVSQTLSILLSEIFGKDDISEIFDDDMFLDAVMYLRPKLLKDTWKSYPGAVVCYKWLLQIIKKPFLKGYVTDVLPTALIIFDDYVPENQMLGLECIDTILDHCQKSRSLKNLNYDEVLFQALKKAALKGEPNLLVLLYTSLGKLLENIRFCEDNANVFEWNKYDEVIAILLEKMELLYDIDMRFSYTLSLNGLMIHSSIGKWSERLTRILCEYCDDGLCFRNTNATLDLLKKFFSIYQPKGINCYTSLYCSLLRLCYIQKRSSEGNHVIVEKTVECLNLLSDLCPILSQEIKSNAKVKAIIDNK